MSNDAKQSGFVAFDGSPCPVVLACDDAYGMPLATTLRSLVDANKSAWPIECFVLSDRISESTRSRVLASLPHGAATVQWIPVELDDFAEYSTAAHISRITYARLLLPKLMPAHVRTLLYLDTDLLIFDDVRPLCGTNLNSFPLGAVEDGFMDRAIKTNLAGYERLPRVSRYFNAGVLLVNLEQWRAEKIPDKAADFLAAHPDSPYSDQDALNVACEDRWFALDGRWNFQDHRFAPIAERVKRERTAVVHFITNEKPWVPHILSPNAGLFDAYRNRTCYARTPWDKLRDFAVRTWTRTRRCLGRWEAGRQLWKSFSRAHAC
jgi:lipopolysaccharide biosynthesis glycosyltransferase